MTITDDTQHSRFHEEEEKKKKTMLMNQTVVIRIVSQKKWRARPELLRLAKITTGRNTTDKATEAWTTGLSQGTGPVPAKGHVSEGQVVGN